MLLFAACLHEIYLYTKLFPKKHVVAEDCFFSLLLLSFTCLLCPAFSIGSPEFATLDMLFSRPLSCLRHNCIPERRFIYVEHSTLRRKSISITINVVYRPLLKHGERETCQNTLRLKLSDTFWSILIYSLPAWPCRAVATGSYLYHPGRRLSREALSFRGGSEYSYKPWVVLGCRPAFFCGLWRITRIAVFTRHVPHVHVELRHDVLTNKLLPHVKALPVI